MSTIRLFYALGASSWQMEVNLVNNPQFWDSCCSRQNKQSHCCRRRGPFILASQVPCPTQAITATMAPCSHRVKCK